MRGPLPAVPECTACGTCCFSTLPEYIRVFACDWDRMDQRARNFTQALGHGSFMRFVDGHCAALTIDPVARRFLCSIYPMRPDCCQALQRGSGACLSDLQEKGDRPLIAVERLLRRGSAKSAPTG